MRFLRDMVLGIGGMAITLIVLFRVMGAMAVHDDARIILSAYACPQAAEKLDDGLCAVNGSLSRRLLTGDAEIKLADDSLWIVQDDAVRAYKYSSESTRYVPGGKAVAFVLGLLILVVGSCLSLGLPLYLGRKKESVAS